MQHLPEELKRPSSMEVLSPALSPSINPQRMLSEAVPAAFQYQSEEEKILGALRQANNNKAKAAKFLGVSRSTLYRQMERYNISG